MRICISSTNVLIIITSSGDIDDTSVHHLIASSLVELDLDEDDQDLYAPKTWLLKPRTISSTPEGAPRESVLVTNVLVMPVNL